MNTMVPPAPPKRLAYKCNTEWSTDDDSEAQNEPNDLRDSGISTASLLDFQSHLSNLNNLGYEDFEPRTRCNDILNISPSVINALNVSTANFASSMFQESHSLPSQEVIILIVKFLLYLYFYRFIVIIFRLVHHRYRRRRIKILLRPHQPWKECQIAHSLMVIRKIIQYQNSKHYLWQPIPKALCSNDNEFPSPSG